MTEALIMSDKIPETSLYKNIFLRMLLIPNAVMSLWITFESLTQF